MNRTMILALLLSFSSSLLTAQTEAERLAIKQFCGCFEVSFEYKETFAKDSAYQYNEPYRADAIEYIVLEEETPTKLVMQNLLVIDDTTVIKHWRQDWEYQPAHQINFLGNKTWEVAAIDKKGVKGQWSQEVYEVDDSPRFSGSATWFLADGKQAWENLADAPLPRREYTKRSDYQILRRNNRLSLKEWGWVHEQDNEKVVLDGNSEKVLVEEKGRNTYRRIDTKNCQLAIDFWKEQQPFWTQVRYVWDEFLEEPGAYTLEKRQGDSFLPHELKDLSKQKFNNEKEARDAIRNLLNKYRTSLASANR